VKNFRSVRRVAHTAYLAGIATLCSSGCATNTASLASLNPFAKSAEPAAEAPAGTASTPGQFATMRQTVAGQANNLSLAASSAWTKTKSGVSGLLGSESPATDQAGNPLAEDDPTRLSSPASVSPEVFVAQGALWETSGDFTKAMDSYTRALQTEPGNAAALASVARLHLRQEQLPQAADHFRKAIEANPKDAALLNDYGMTQAKMGDLTGAVQSLTKALELSPGTSRFANNLANVSYDAGDADGALAVLMQHNKPAVAHFNMAYLHYRAGNYAGAKTQLNEVLQYESLGERDSAVAQAVSRSRDMLAQMDSGVARIAEAAPRALATANQVVNAFAPPPVGENTAAAQALGGQATAGPTVAPVQGSSPAATMPAAGPSPAGAFTLPPDVFQQPLN